MTRVSWDTLGGRTYETGVDRGVLYPDGLNPVPWNGLVSITEATSDTDISSNYIDGSTIKRRHTPGSFSATVEAITYPDELEKRKPFGLCYRTKVGTDITGSEYDYKIHLVYNARAQTADKDFGSLNASVEGQAFSWDISTRPVLVDGYQPTAHIIVDASIAHSVTVKALEDLIYGTDTNPPRLPSPQEVLDVFDINSLLKVTKNEDGSWTIEGPDNAVYQNSDGSWTIDWPSVVQLDTHTYQISSM